MSWLGPVRAALDARVDDPCPVFVRDDDAGWGDHRLLALLDVLEEAGVPVDLAVIPTELTGRLAGELTARAGRARVGLHQHGYAHRNHEPAGRKHEFGPSRSAAQQAADLGAGRALLLEHLGDLVEPVFTPPWNRCTAATAAALAGLGVRVLSRDLTAAPLADTGLTQVPVHVDWFGHRKGVRWSLAELGAVLAARLTAGGPVGLMLHHAVTDAGELARVGELARLLGEHPGAAPTTIMGVALAGSGGPRAG